METLRDLACAAPRHDLSPETSPLRTCGVGREVDRQAETVCPAFNESPTLFSEMEEAQSTVKPWAISFVGGWKHGSDQSRGRQLLVLITFTTVLTILPNFGKQSSDPVGVC
jgi:hypothetical protein